MKLIRSITIFALILCASAAALAQGNGSIGGTVTDLNGAIVRGATVQVVGADGKVVKETTTNNNGEYNITGIPAGKYTIRSTAASFGVYENAEVAIAPGKNELAVLLPAKGVDENVNVNIGDQVSTDLNENKDATVIKGKDLDSLPDDPDELAAALQALAGPGAGPNGGQIYIDGFTGGQLPSKDSIREIRINQNPFSAEFDRPGFGRIDILTKPGSDKFRGSVNSTFNSSAFNSRNPFTTTKAKTQQRNFGGNLSGPIKKGKASYSLDVNQRSNDNNAVINAQILDNAFNIVSFKQDLRVPTRNFNIGSRIDFAINSKNTLVARYGYNQSSSTNQGVGGTALASRAFENASHNHELRMTETAIINAKTVNETRFEYSKNRRVTDGGTLIPGVNVAEAFSGGGAQVGLSFNTNQTFEVNNFTSTSFGKKMQHQIKFGGMLRHVGIDDRSQNNYAGSFTFAGFFGADAADITGPSGSPDGVVSAIEQYRAKLLGLAGAQYNPTQFSITAGDPLASVGQYNYGLFFTDDWRVNPALVLGFGVRYENQTNISSDMNFAPRFSFAWSPGAGGAKAPKMVFRGGGGIFYDRFGENFTLQAIRQNGTLQQQFFVSANETDPARRAIALGLLAQPTFTSTGVTNVPTAAQIQGLLGATASTIRKVGDIKAPYNAQFAFSVERQLPKNTVLTATFIHADGFNQLRSRNINAPVCPLQVNCSGMPRPNPALGNIYQYESTGKMHMNRLQVQFRTSFNQHFSLFGGYGLGFQRGDTDSAGTFPAYMYDLTGESGRSSNDVRHSFNVGGSVSLPWQITLNPNINVSAGRPFNITRGVDLNGDGLFTERPTFAELGARCTLLNLTTSWCDITGQNPSSIVPRNWGLGPPSFTVNMRVGKTFGFGKSPEQVASGGNGNRSGAAGNNRAGGGGGGGNARGGGGGGGPQTVMMGGGGGGGAPQVMMMGGGGGGFGNRKPYNLNIGVNFSNLLNRVNLGNPSGSLASSRFGQSTGTGGNFGPFGGGGGGPNRRIDLNMRFSW